MTVAEAIAPDIKHAEAVYLANARSIGIDERKILHDRFLRAVAQTRRAALPFIEGVPDIIA